MGWLTRLFDISSLMSEPPITRNNQVIDMGHTLTEEAIKLGVQDREKALSANSDK